MRQLLERYQVELEQVKQLMREYSEAEEGTSKEREARGLLRNYLNHQDMAFVKMIQVVLHIGKTKQVGGEESSEKLFEETYQAFDMLKGWRPKEIEVHNMIIKVPMEKYLDKGLLILRK
ncbi:MAG: hypothetical protein ACRCTE_05775 [Cellulosilyticaceae bacterium]